MGQTRDFSFRWPRIKQPGHRRKLICAIRDVISLNAAYPTHSALLNEIPGRFLDESNGNSNPCALLTFDRFRTSKNSFMKRRGKSFDFDMHPNGAQLRIQERETHLEDHFAAAMHFRRIFFFLFSSKMLEHPCETGKYIRDGAMAEEKGGGGYR